MIFFGSDDGTIYSVDINGESFSGWPKDIGGSAIGSIVFGDLDGDGSHEIISSVNSEIRILNQDGSDFIYSSIIHDLPLASGPTIMDINNDGNLEVIVGTGTDLSSIDFKFESNNISTWNMHRSNLKRTGFYLSTSGMNPGDINQDQIIDILDLVMIVNYILGIQELEIIQIYAADLNEDGVINIQDIINIINKILEN